MDGGVCVALGNNPYGSKGWLAGDDFSQMFTRTRFYSLTAPPAPQAVLKHGTGTVLSLGHLPT